MRTTEFLKKGGKFLIKEIAFYLDMFISSVVFARDLGVMAGIQLKELIKTNLNEQN